MKDFFSVVPCKMYMPNAHAFKKSHMHNAAQQCPYHIIMFSVVLTRKQENIVGDLEVFEREECSHGTVNVLLSSQRLH